MDNIAIGLLKLAVTRSKGFWPLLPSAMQQVNLKLLYELSGKLQF